MTGRAGRVTARAPGLAPYRRSALKRLLLDGPAGRRRILRQGLGASLLWGLDYFPFVSRLSQGSLPPPPLPERARYDILSHFPVAYP